MNRRSVLAGLAIVAAVAVAVPAVAQDIQGPNPLSTNIKRVGDEARNLAHKALKKSNRALRKARKAVKLAGPAGAAGQTGATGAPGGGATPFFAQAAGAESTGDDTQFVQLPGGPSVTVNVPQAANGPPGTGSIEVAASAVIGEDSGGVALFEDGAPMPGQSDFCADAAPGPPLFVSPDAAGSGLGSFTYSTPAVPALGCSSTGAPSAVLFTTDPGVHTYELRYAYCGCDPPPAEATFSDRRLWVTPLG